MKKILSLLSPALFPALLLAQSGREGAFISNGRKVDIATFNAGVEKILQETDIPGLSLAVIEDNKIVFSNAYGYKKSDKKEKVDKNTLFEAASQSKSYLVYVVYQLVEEGRLDLDKPMYQYLPYEALEHDPRYKLITPRMILSHCSGIENWSSYNQVDTLEILYDPGTKFVYSGEGYNYLAKVVAGILHKDYDEYIEERVIRTLGLKNACLKFREDSTDHSLFPSDYAEGHDILARYTGSHLNRRTNPAFANHNTAEDYAKIVLAIFDHTHFSDRVYRDLLQPRIVTGLSKDGSAAAYYGPGFEVIYSGGDTLIGQGGSNPGFKNQLYYSVVHKRGFIYMTNGDRGRVLVTRLSQMTAGLPLKPYFNIFDEEQYPSVAGTFLDVYIRKDSLAMYDAIEKQRLAKKLDMEALNDLGETFLYYDQDIARRLLEENKMLYPQSPRVHFLLATLDMRMSRYDSAYQHYCRARDLKYNPAVVSDDLAKCQVKLDEAARRKPLLVRIGDNKGDTIEAENYNAMYGIEIQGTTDTGGGHCVGYIDPGKWMDYRLNVARAGTYVVYFRVSSIRDDNKMELRSGPSLLTTVDVPSTKGWQTWTTIKTNVNLPAGEQTLRLNFISGAYNINWMYVTKADDNATR